MRRKFFELGRNNFLHTILIVKLTYKFSEIKLFFVTFFIIQIVLGEQNYNSSVFK